jgi:hypothetical protein
MTMGQPDYEWHSGWRLIRPDSDGLASVGGVMVPAAFQIHAYRFDNTGRYRFSAYLGYEVQAGELRLRGIQCTTHEVDEAVGILRGEKSWRDWKQFALMLLFADEKERSGGTPEEVGEAIRLAHGMPVRRTRTRVTDSTLQQVAEVYRRAWGAGEPPTLAVANHFYKSHSTAARWVGLARERGYLGKANGTRGGEASPQDQGGKARE